MKAVSQIRRPMEIRALLISAVLLGVFFFICGSARGQKSEAGPAAPAAENPSKDSRPAENISRGKKDEKEPSRAPSARGKASVEEENQVLAAADRGEKARGAAGIADVLKVFAWLAVVLAMMVGVVYLLRRFMPANLPGKSGQYIRVISRTSLSPKHSIYLVKCGSKLLVLGVTPENINCLSVVGPAEMPDLPGGISSGFEKALAEFQPEKNTPKGTAEEVRRELDDIIQKVSNWKNPP